MKATVIYHSADFDGIFCREIARHFLPSDTEFIGWNFNDKLIPFPYEGQIYILDLSPDCLGGDTYDSSRIVWIDHHKTSIEKWPASIPGYRIDGVAACRLAWQWFSFIEKGLDPHRNQMDPNLPCKEQFVNRQVSEPIAVRMAGEYDIWDKRDPNAEVFQFGLRSRTLDEIDWKTFLSASKNYKWSDDVPTYIDRISTALSDGLTLQRYQQSNDAKTMGRAFVQEFEGLNFLTLNTAQCNSLTFASKDMPATGHDALMGFYWNGSKWIVSLYHAKHRTDIDLSQIAVKYGGGGHRGACGFSSTQLPFNFHSKQL